MPPPRQRQPVRRPSPSAAGASLDREFRDRLMKVIYERSASCPQCRYSLNGIVGTRCPECGLVVEEYLRVADTMPRRWRALRRQQTRWVRLLVCGIACIVVFGGIVYATVLFG